MALLDKHFPPGNPLHSLLNRKTIKVSYKCLPNIASILAKNNSKVLNADKGPNAQEKCNCRKKQECPMPGKCQTTSLIYQASVKTEEKTETYVGLTVNSFKKRYSGHKSSFKHNKRRHETTLSKYIWELKDKKVDYTLIWTILARAQPFTQVTGLCHLCTREKHFVIFKSDLCTLNSRNELLSSCRHKRANLLVMQNRKQKKKKKTRNRGN